MSHINKIIANIALIGGIISLLISTSCSASSPGSGPPDGYLATDANSVTFLQFTRNSNQLTGQMEGVEATNDVPPQTKSSNYSFTGTQDGSAITITFSVLWTSTSFTGKFSGDTLTLELPQSDGHITSVTFKGASIQQYNQAVDALQQQVHRQDQQYYKTQATATAQQEEQDALTNANDALRHALGALNSDSHTLSAFSETSTLSAYARDWQTMQNDYAKEKNDAAKGCGDGNYNYSTVQYDAGSVDYDYGSIQYDDGSLSYDKNTYTSELSAVQNDISTVETDWTNLQIAVKANTTGIPAPAYTQSDIDTAVATAQNAETAAQNVWQSAQASASQYDSEASNLKTQADAIPGSMGC